MSTAILAGNWRCLTGRIEKDIDTAPDGLVRSSRRRSVEAEHWGGDAGRNDDGTVLNSLPMRSKSRESYRACQMDVSQVAIHATASPGRSEGHTSELQSLMRTSYAVFCLKKKRKTHI